MGSEKVSRRTFLGQAALAAGVVALGGSVRGQLEAAGGAVVKRTARDVVGLGKTGLKVSRLGIGLGSANGAVQAALGQEGLNGLIKVAVERGITLLDVAQNYRTFGMLGEAIKGLPREKVFIQSKIESPREVLKTIDLHRKTFQTDYVDCMLIHVQYKEGWTETWKRAMGEMDEALEKKWILAKGVSCHSLPALRESVASEWVQVHLVRVNPQGVRIDNEKQEIWGGAINPVEPVLAELKRMKEKGRGVIGMKIFGNGEFKTDAEREKSMRFAMGLKELDAVVIGFKDVEELEKGIGLMDRILGEA